MRQLTHPKVQLAVLWAILIAVSAVIRPLFPVDETRYAAVAWEMWVRNDFLVPHLNGDTYSHKPPLLFWLMQLSWFVFGVNDWSLRLVSPIFSLATLYLSGRLAKALWPETDGIDDLTSFILLGNFFWLFYSTLTMFDIMLSFFAVFGIFQLVRLVRDGLSTKGWLGVGLAIGGGVLTKGPVILLHILPVALLAPIWLKGLSINFRLSQWYRGIGFSILIGAGIALCWAIPAGIVGGEEYRKAIFLGQTSGRLVESFAHRLPWWWYCQFLPLLLLPWLVVKPFWLAWPQIQFDFGMRFCMTWLIPVFLAFSLISGKRMHYLLPLLPGLAMLTAHILSAGHNGVWRRAHLLYAILCGLLAAMLIALSWLNVSIGALQIMSGLSPYWGLFLFMIALVIGIIQTSSIHVAIRIMALMSVTSVLVMAGGFFSINAYRYNTKPPAEKIADLLAKKQDVIVYTRKYHGQYHFTGRLTQPLKVISELRQLQTFVEHNQNAYVLVTYNKDDNLPDDIFDYQYPYKNQSIGFIKCVELFNQKALMAKLTPI